MFVGDRYQLTFNGSFNGNENLEEIPPGDFAIGSRNINQHNGGAEKRGGTQKVGAQIAAGLQSLGGGALVKRSTGDIYTYWAGDDGKLYRNGVSIQTGRSTTDKAHFSAINDSMFICNGVASVQVDTGASLAAISAAAADWTGTTHPKKVILHSKGASRRAFAWGVQGHENTLYYSSLGAFETFTGGTSGTVNIDFQDGYGIIDCVSKDGTLWIFGRSETYILDDSSTDVATWGYMSASFKGGAHSPRLVKVINNSIYVMNTQGDVYEVVTAEQLRDYEQASITEPFYIHNYIRSEIDLARIDDFHMEYEPRTKALSIFMIRNSQTTVEVCLKYFVNQQKWAPPHDSFDNTTRSGYSASAAYEIQTSVGVKKLYTQDYNGYTWELESTTKTDDGQAYESETYSGSLDFDLEGEEKRFPFGQLHYRSRGDYEINVICFVEEVEQTAQSVSLAATGAALDSFTLDTDRLSIIGPSIREFEIGQIGNNVRISVNNGEAGADFFLSSIVFPFIRRGVQRQ
jgi:hypothetical protein